MFYYIHFEKSDLVFVFEVRGMAARAHALTLPTELSKAESKSDQMYDANGTQSLITNTGQSVVCLSALKIKLSLSHLTKLSGYYLLFHATAKLNGMN